MPNQHADWPCYRCGKHGTVNDGHVVLTTGPLKDPRARVETFCGECAEKELRK